MNEKYQFPNMNPEDQRKIDLYNDTIESVERYRRDYVTDLGHSTLDKIKAEIAEEVLGGFINKLIDERDELVTSILSDAPRKLNPELVGVMIDGQLVEEPDTKKNTDRLAEYQKKFNSL